LCLFFKEFIPQVKERKSNLQKLKARFERMLIFYSRKFEGMQVYKSETSIGRTNHNSDSVLFNLIHILILKVEIRTQDWLEESRKINRILLLLKEMKFLYEIGNGLIRKKVGKPVWFHKERKMDPNPCGFIKKERRVKIFWIH
jgi:hypothetical protein